MQIKTASTQTFIEHRGIDAAGEKTRNPPGTRFLVSTTHFWSSENILVANFATSHHVVVVCSHGADKRSKESNSHTAGERTWDPDTLQVY